MTHKPHKTHPSYGMARFTRTQGGKRKLFGSATPEHGTTIMLAISAGSIKHDLGRDWYFGSDDYIEVELSPAQFVELLTTMNIGSGVPCTVRFVQGKGKIEDPPDEGTESERVRDYFQEKINETLGRIKSMEAAIRAAADKPRLNKGDANHLLGEVQQLVQEVEKNMPFYYEQFDKAVQKREATAKAEIESAVTLALQRLGFTKLKELQEALGDAPLQLEDGKE